MGGRALLATLSRVCHWKFVALKVHRKENVKRDRDPLIECRELESLVGKQEDD